MEADDAVCSDGFAVVYRATPGSLWEKIALEDVECIVSDERRFVRVRLERFSSTAVAYGTKSNSRSMKNKITFARTKCTTADTRDLMVVLLPFECEAMGGGESVGVNQDPIQNRFITTTLAAAYCLNADDSPQEYWLADSMRGVLCITCGVFQL